MMMTSLLAENGNDLGKAMTILMNQNRTTDTESSLNLMEQDSLVKALKRAHEGLKKGVEQQPAPADDDLKEASSSSREEEAQAAVPSSVSAAAAAAAGAAVE